MSLKHFVMWRVTIKELEELIEMLKETPLISFPLDNVELAIVLKDEK